MHENGLIHRDIKPENILIKNSGDISCIKLADFGTSDLIKNKLISKVTGTEKYMAPEILLKQKYDNKVDLWSLGILLYVLLTSSLPFKTYEEALTVPWYQGMNCEMLKGMSNECEHFIGKLLERNPFKRYTAQEALADKWVSNAEIWSK